MRYGRCRGLLPLTTLFDADAQVRLLNRVAACAPALVHRSTARYVAGTPS